MINLDITKIKTNNATNMNGKFRISKMLQNIDRSNFNTCKVKDMSNLFNECIYLKY